MMKITLELDSETVQYVISVLAQRPYAEVAEILGNIGRQFNSQRPAPDGNGRPAALTQ